MHFGACRKQIQRQFLGMSGVIGDSCPEASPFERLHGAFEVLPGRRPLELRTRRAGVGQRNGHARDSADLEGGLSTFNSVWVGIGDGRSMDPPGITISGVPAPLTS